MSKLRTDQIETLDGLHTKNVSDLIVDANEAQVNTSTGEQTLVEALDRRVIYVDTIADLQALDTSELVDGQHFSTKGDEYVLYSGSFIPKRFFSPDSYGAVGDGVSDDTLAVQQAIDDARDNSGAVIMYGKDYAVSGVNVHSGTVIEAHKSKLILLPNTDSNVITHSDLLSGVTEVLIKGLEIDGNAGNQGTTSKAAILFKNSSNIVLDGCYIHDTKMSTFIEDAYDQVMMVGVTHCKVTRCRITNSGQGALSMKGGPYNEASYNTVIDCPAGIEGVGEDGRVVGNTIKGTSYACINVSDRSVISGNNCSDSSSGAGIVCGHSGDPGTTANFSVISGNIIKNVYSSGIQVYNTDDIKISGNAIIREPGNYSSSILFKAGCNRSVVSNNTVYDYQTTGSGATSIIFEGTTSGSVIEGNSIYGSNGGGTGRGIRMYGECHDTSIIGNTVVDSQGAGVEIGSTSSNTITANNIIKNSGAEGVRDYGSVCLISGNRIDGSGTSRGIMIDKDDFVITNNVISNCYVGIYTNTANYGAISGNTILSTVDIGVSLASESDYNAVSANVLRSTTSVSGTGANNKYAHNIGLTDHVT